MGDIFRLYGWMSLITGWDKISVHTLSQWAKRDKRLEKGTFSAIFPRLHSLKVLPVYCGNISYEIDKIDIGEPPWHTAGLSESLLTVQMWFWVVSCQQPEKNTRQVHPFSSQPHSDCIHPFLFIRVQNAPMQKLPQRTGCRPLLRRFVSYLLGAITVSCLARRLGLCTAIFGSGFRTSLISCMMYIQVYIVVPSLPLWKKKVLPPFFLLLLHPFLYLSRPPFVGRLMLPSS